MACQPPIRFDGVGERNAGFSSSGSGARARRAVVSSIGSNNATAWSTLPLIRFHGHRLVPEEARVLAPAARDHDARCCCSFTLPRRERKPRIFSASGGHRARRSPARPAMQCRAAARASLSA